MAGVRVLGVRGLGCSGLGLRVWFKGFLDLEILTTPPSRGTNGKAHGSCSKYQSPKRPWYRFRVWLGSPFKEVYSQWSLLSRDM